MCSDYIALKLVVADMITMYMFNPLARISQKLARVLQKRMAFIKAALV